MLVTFKHHKGFTLVEIMVTIAILSILIAYAVPNYQEIIRKVRRDDAMATLGGEAERLSRCFSDRDSLAGCVDEFDNGQAIPSPQGHYEITANINNINGVIYTLTATAVGEQARDVKCATFTINSLGSVSARDSSNNDTTSICWD